MPRQQLISKAEFSRKYGISAAMAGKLTKKKLLKAMCGNRIDINHASVTLYLAERRKRELEAADEEVNAAKRVEKVAKPTKKTILPTAKEPKQPRGRPKRKTHAIDEGFLQPPEDDELKEFNDMPLKEILRRYGTMTQFKDLLTSTKVIEDIHAKRIANAKASGDLISRELVHTYVFGAIEAILIRLIQDSPRTITARLFNAFESGQTVEEGEVIVRNLQSSQIKGMKKEVEKGLKSA